MTDGSEKRVIRREVMGGFWEFLEEGPRTPRILLAFSFIVLLLILKEVLVPFIIAAILAALTWPIRTKLLKWTGGRAGLTAGILIIGMILLVVAPIGTVLIMATLQARELFVNFEPHSALTWVLSQQSKLEHSQIAHQLGLKSSTLAPKLQEGLTRVTSWGLSQILTIGSSLLNALILSGIALMCLFYLYLTGDKMVDRVRNLVPLPSDQVGELLLVFRKTSRAIFKGHFVIGGIQGLLTGVLFWATGLPSPAFFGVAAAFCSLIPAVGAALIWLPAAVFLLIAGDVGRALVVLGVGTVVISTMDNILRPSLVGRDAGMQDMMIFLTTIGGLSFFGPVGILFGPLVGAGVTALLRLQEVAQAQE